MHENFGSFEIVTGPAAPSRIIKSHSDFTVAWERYIEAATFVFPHRKRELDDYGKYIKQLFTSVPEELHGRVIHFDKAVRLRVAQRRDLMLTDHYRFSDLYTMWIQYAGPSSSSSISQNRRGGGGGSNTPSKKREACNRWNNGICPNSAATCSRSHICNICRHTGHVSKHCTSAPEGNRK